MDQKVVLNKIQELLKERGITYLVLANYLGLSHAALKRIFSKQQITFENLIKICNYLNVSLSDLFYELEQENLKAFTFTPEQEIFFADHPNYLSYFYQMRAKKTPGQIQARFGLTDKSSSKYLKKLKSFNLLKIVDGDYVININLPIFWEDDGPLGKVFSNRMIQELVDRATTSELILNKPFLDLKNFVFSRAQHEDYLSDIKRLNEKYQSISTQNSKLKRKTNIALSSLFVLGERQFSLFEEIPEI